MSSTNYFIIEKAEPADIPQMVAVINSCYRGDGSKQGWTTEADLIAGDLRTDEADVAQLMAKPTTTFLVYRHPEEGILGSVYLDKQGDRLYLGMLSVNTAKQASGIGGRLMRAAEELARLEACTAMFMQVIPVRDELLAWYERNGYVPTGERKPFDGDPRFGVPRVPLEFVFLEKKLTNL
ncbi:MAG: GNAT family N-acetyltransferase [Saprospiraceae bacterium]|jgi:ribosomal protein S18 acetylase RimI-like enzyme|nr:GNAT family N-acetyltransferase [Saprospiraceae bacterium]